MRELNTKHRRISILTGLAILALVLSACSSGGTGATATPVGTSTVTPTVTINDQSVASGTVTVADVLSVGPGWIAIQSDNNQTPGDILGSTLVKDGDNQNVTVKIDPLKSTPVMYAVLYSDAGQTGVFEPTGADKPQTVGGQPVQPIFNVTGGLPSPTATLTPGPTPTSAATVHVFNSPNLGNFLTDTNGATLYFWKHDAPDTSYCTGACLETWPPFLTNGKPITGDTTIQGELGVYVRPDGRQQVTFQGIPLYYYSKDQKSGDTTGQGLAGMWFVVPAGGFPTPTPTATATSLTPAAPTETPIP